jgi:hypothetical protein
MTRDPETQKTLDELRKKSSIIKMFEEAVDKNIEDDPVTLTFTRGELVFLMMMNNLAMAHQINDEKEIELVMPMIAYLGMIYGDSAIRTLHQEGKESYEKLWQVSKIMGEIENVKDDFFK